MRSGCAGVAEVSLIGAAGAAGLGHLVAGPDLALAAAAAVVLVAVAWRDYAALRIPDGLVVMLAVGAVLRSSLAGTEELGQAAVGAASLYAIGLGASTWARAHLCEVGAGDTKLLAVCGAWLGVAGGAVIAAIACFAAALIIAVGARERPDAVVLVPFGALLAPLCALAIVGAAVGRAL